MKNPNPFPGVFAPPNPQQQRPQARAVPRGQRRGVSSPRERVSNNPVIKLIRAGGEPGAKEALRESSARAMLEALLEVNWAMLETMDTLVQSQFFLSKRVHETTDVHFPLPQAPPAPEMGAEPNAQQQGPQTAGDAGVAPPRPPPSAPGFVPQGAPPVGAPGPLPQAPPMGSASHDIHDPPAELLDDLDNDNRINADEEGVQGPAGQDFSDELAEMGIGPGPVDFAGPPMPPPAPGNVPAQPGPQVSGDNGPGNPVQQAVVSKPTGPIDASAAVDSD